MSESSDLRALILEAHMLLAQRPTERVSVAVTQWLERADSALSVAGERTLSTQQEPLTTKDEVMPFGSQQRIQQAGTTGREAVLGVPVVTEGRDSVNNALRPVEGSVPEPSEDLSDEAAKWLEAPRPDVRGGCRVLNGLSGVSAGCSRCRTLEASAHALLDKLSAMGGGFNGILGAELRALRAALDQTGEEK